MVLAGAVLIVVVMWREANLGQRV